MLIFTYNYFRICKKCKSIYDCVWIYLILYKFSLATTGVCVFYASASVGAFFNLQIIATNFGGAVFTLPIKNVPKISEQKGIKQ